MSTEIRVSITGLNKRPIRVSIAELMASKGLRRRNCAEFTSHDAITPELAAQIISGVYDQEAKHSGVQVTTLRIRSTLVNAELKKDKYRSI